MIPLSDQILDIVEGMHTLDGAKLRWIAVQVRRMELSLDEIVDEAMEKANASRVVYFPPQSRRH